MTSTAVMVAAADGAAFWAARGVARERMRHIPASFIELSLRGFEAGSFIAV
jgi:hypothetical protein